MDQTSPPVHPPTCLGAAALSDRTESRRARTRAVLRGIRDVVFRLADWLVVVTTPSRTRRGIAVIMPHGLGDLLLLTPALDHIRARHPGEPIVLVCSAAARSYAETYVKPDLMIVVDRVRLRRDLVFRVGTLVSIARAGASIALQPSYNREHLIEDALVRATGASRRIGADGSDILISKAERSRGDRWYTQIVASSPNARHESDYYGMFAAAVTGVRPSDWLPHLPVPPRHADVPAEPYMVVACQSSSPVKTWPAERFAEAAKAVSSSTGLRLVVVGHAGGQTLSGVPDVIDLCGTTDLPGLVAVLAHARVVLCNDSAPVHLAAALGIPAVAVCGGGIPDRYLPYPPIHPHRRPPVIVTMEPVFSCFGCGWRCQYTSSFDAPFPCVAEVPASRVVQTIVAALRGADAGKIRDPLTGQRTAQAYPHVREATLAPIASVGSHWRHAETDT